MPTVCKPKSPLKATQREVKRATYLLAINRGATKRQACIQAGLEPHAATRIDQLLDETHSLRDRPRLGRPCLYTDKIMQDVEAVFAENPQMRTTSTTLVPFLVEHGILHQGANKAVFMHAWHQYRHRQHKRLTATSTSTRFFLKPQDKSDRVQYAKKMLELLNHRDAWWAIFMDETTLEENPHPKSGV